jgi:hypothetical protein
VGSVVKDGLQTAAKTAAAAKTTDAFTTAACEYSD